MLWYKLLQNTTYCVTLRFTSYPIYGPVRQRGLRINYTEGGQVWTERLSP